MKYKILSKKEYDELSISPESTIVSGLDIILSLYQLVVIDMEDGFYKILKYPKVLNVISGDEDEHLGILITKDELEKFIFLTNI